MIPYYAVISYSIATMGRRETSGITNRSNSPFERAKPFTTERESKEPFFPNALVKVKAFTRETSSGNEGMSGLLQEAARTKKPVLFCVSRSNVHGPINWTYGGVPFIPDFADSDTEKDQFGKNLILSSPPGTLAEIASSTDLSKSLGGFDHWVSLNVSSTLRSPGQVEGKIGDEGGGFAFDEKILNRETPVAYVVRVRPISEEAIDKSILQVRHAIYSEQGSRRAAREGQRDLAALLALLESLQESKLTGRFAVDVLVGGKSEQDVQIYASQVLQATANGLPYKIELNSTTHATVEEAINANPPSEQNYGLSGKAVEAFIPAKPQKELVGVEQRLKKNEWGVNIPRLPEVPAERRIPIGTIIDEYDQEMPGNPVDIDVQSVFSHYAVYGETNSGKTGLLKAMVSGVARKDIPSVYFDPKGSKEGKPGVAEDLANELKAEGIKVRKIKIGDLKSVLVGINLFDPGDAPLKDHINEVITILANAFASETADNAEKLQDQEAIIRFLRKALRGDPIEKGSTSESPYKRRFIGVYEQNGLDPDSGKPLVEGSKPLTPTALHVCQRVIDAAEGQLYEGEAQNFVKWLTSVTEGQGTGIAGKFLGSLSKKSNILIEKLFDGVNVVETPGLSDSEYALIAGTLLLEAKKRAMNTTDKMALFIDEFNKFVPKNSPLAEEISDMAAMLREYEVGLVIAAQSPAMVPDRVNDNIAGGMFVMRVPSPRSIEVVRGPLGLRAIDQEVDIRLLEQRKFVATLGNMGMQRPIRGRVRFMEFKGDATPDPSWSLADDSAPHITLEDRIDMDRVFFDSDEGRALQGLAYFTLLNKLCGLDKQIEVDYKYLNNPDNNIYHFNKIRDLNPDQREYLVDTAVRRIVYSAARYKDYDGEKNEFSLLNLATHKTKDYPEGITIEDIVTKIKEGVFSALDGAPLDPEPDRSVMLPEFKSLWVKAQILKYIGNAPQSMQQKLGRPKNIKELEAIYGGKIEGETAWEMVSFLHNAQPSTKDLFFLEPFYGSGFLLDAPVGISLKEAIEAEQPMAWNEGFRNLLQYFNFSQSTLALFQQEIFNHLKFLEMKITKETKENEPIPDQKPSREPLIPSLPQVIRSLQAMEGFGHKFRIVTKDKKINAMDIASGWRKIEEHIAPESRPGELIPIIIKTVREVAKFGMEQGILTKDNVSDLDKVTENLGVYEKLKLPGEELETTISRVGKTMEALTDYCNRYGIIDTDTGKPNIIAILHEMLTVANAVDEAAPFEQTIPQVMHIVGAAHKFAQDHGLVDESGNSDFFRVIQQMADFNQLGRGTTIYEGNGSPDKEENA